MAVILQQQQQPSIKRLLELAASQKSLKEARRAADVYGNVDWGDPNAMVSGRVVKTHPVTLLANALRQGMATHYQVQADEKESELEAQKQQAMLGMIESGKSGLKEMAASGLLPPDKLAEALAKQSATQAEYQFLPGEGGTWLKGNKGTGDIQPSGFKNPLYDPAQQLKLKGISEALKGGTAKDATGHEYYAPAMQRSPFYQQFLGQDSYDQPTTMMPAPGQPKAAMQPPPPAQMPPPGQGAGDVEISPDASPEDRAMLEQIARQQGLGIVGQQPPQEPPLGQSPAEEAAAKAQATMPIEVQQAAQIAAQKAQIENEAKLQQQQQADQYTRGKDATDALGLIEEAKGILPGSTNSGIGTLMDDAAALVGQSTPGADKAAQLRVIGGSLISKMPKMSGPQSDKDVLLYKEMAGKIGDSTTPVSQRQAALETIQKLQEKYIAPMDKNSEIEALRRKHGL